MKIKLFILIFFLSLTQNGFANGRCESLFSATEIQVSSHLEFAQLNFRISNIFRMAVYSGLVKSGLPSEAASAKAKEMADAIFYNPIATAFYLKALLTAKQSDQIANEALFEITGNRTFQNLSDDQKGIVFLFGGANKSKRKTILSELKTLENLLPSELRTEEIISNPLVPVILYLEVFGINQARLKVAIEKSQLSASQLALIKDYVAIHKQELQSSEDLRLLHYPEDYKKPAEFLPFRSAPKYLQTKAANHLRRLYISGREPSEGITLTDLGRDQLFLTMAHNIRYLNAKLSKERETNSGAHLLMIDIDGSTKRVDYESVKTFDAQSNEEMHLSVLRIDGIGSHFDAKSLQIVKPIVGQDVHVFGFPNARRLVRSAQNNGVSNPDYSTGKVISIERGNTTTTALGAMGSSGSLAMNSQGQIVGILWNNSPSFRSARTDSETTKSAYEFGNLLAPQDHSYFISLEEIVSLLKPK